MLKKGDLVVMTNQGFAYHGNLHKRFESHIVQGSPGLTYEQFESLACDLLAVQGVGEVLRFNSAGEPFIRFRNSIKGMYFHYSFYYGLDEVRKLTLWEKLKYKLIGRV
jgi:hypothetical protein